MIKIKNKIFILCLLLLLSAGCLPADHGERETVTQAGITEDQSEDAIQGNTNQKDGEESSEPESGMSSEYGLGEEITDYNITGDIVEAEMTDEDIAARERIGLNEEAIAAMLSEQTGNYHFDQLTEDEQRLYAELTIIMREYASGIMVSGTDPPMIEKVFQCVLNDHPEIFYVVGYRYTRYSLEDITKKIAFTATYSIGLQEMQERQQKIDSYVATCLAGMPADGDEYEKVKYIYEFIINRTEYDAEAEDNQNICSVFLKERSVCQGYAKATQYLLKKVGIPATMVMGRVSGGEGHAWNLVRIKGDYYYVDTTWGDASYRIGIDGDSADADGSANTWSGSIPPINYDYLCVTTEQLGKTHTIETIVPIPECTATRDNYYIREGLYFTGVDEDQLQELFEREYENGSQYITLKCSDAEVYRQMTEYLIDDQKIFRYLNHAEEIVKYADMEKQLSLSFWL